MDNNEVTIKVDVPKNILKADKDTRDGIFDDVVENCREEAFSTLGNEDLAKIGAQVIGVLAGAFLAGSLVDSEEAEEKDAYLKTTMILKEIFYKSCKKEVSIVFNCK